MSLIRQLTLALEGVFLEKSLRYDFFVSSLGSMLVFSLEDILSLMLALFCLIWVEATAIVRIVEISN